MAKETMQHRRNAMEERITHDLQTLQSWCNETEKQLGEADDVLMREGETIVTWNNRRRLIWRKES